MKICTQCLIPKDPINFYRNSGPKANKDGKHAWCKACVKNHQKSNKVRRQSYHRKWKYNLTEDEYQELLQRQNNKCALCLSGSKLIVDHCHTTGRVRGLLCFKCNTGIGQLQDSEELLLKAVDYLRLNRVL